MLNFSCDFTAERDVHEAKMCVAVTSITLCGEFHMQNLNSRKQGNGLAFALYQTVVVKMPHRNSLASLCMLWQPHREMEEKAKIGELLFKIIFKWTNYYKRFIYSIIPCMWNIANQLNIDYMDKCISK